MSEGIPQALLFDLDGTLVDTAPDFLAAINALRAEHNYPPCTLEDVRALCSYGALTMVSRALDIAIEHVDEPLRQHFLQLYTHQNGTEATLFHGTEALLERLEAMGVRWGIVTNKPEFLAIPLLAELLPQTPACLVCPDHVDTPKPAPDGLLLAASQLGLATETCVYIGDAVRDSEAAAAANMPFITAAWGYLDMADDPREWHSSGILASPDEILSLLDDALL